MIEFDQASFDELTAAMTASRERHNDADPQPGRRVTLPNEFDIEEVIKAEPVRSRTGEKVA